MERGSPNICACRTFVGDPGKDKVDSFKMAQTCKLAVAVGGVHGAPPLCHYCRTCHISLGTQYFHACLWWMVRAHKPSLPMVLLLLGLVTVLMATCMLTSRCIWMLVALEAILLLSCLLLLLRTVGESM